MPTPVGHALAGLSVFLAGKSEDRWFAFACLLAACFPDLDFALTFITGVSYHHTFTHSLGFALFYLLAAYLLVRWRQRPDPLREAVFIGMAYVSHLVLDLFSEDTVAPYGLELFWPFSTAFLISPVSVFDFVLRGTVARLFGLHNWMAVGKEILILAPVVLLAWWRKRQG